MKKLFSKLNKTALVVFILLVIMPIVVFPILIISGSTNYSIIDPIITISLTPISLVFQIVDSIIFFGAYTDAPRTPVWESILVYIVYIVVMFYIVKSIQDIINQLRIKNK